MLYREVKDPRLSGFITITRVSISADLCHAKVFVSIIGSEEEKGEAFKALSGASGFFRRELSRRLTLRRVPELSFHRDDTIAKGAKVLELIQATEKASGD